MPFPIRLFLSPGQTRRPSADARQHIPAASEAAFASLTPTTSARAELDRGALFPLLVIVSYSWREALREHERLAHKKYSFFRRKVQRKAIGPM
jgi:hypothetical protein